MRQRLAFVLVVGLAVLVVACHPPATIVTAPGKRAYAAHEVLQRVEELQSAAMQAEASGAIPTATARVIVQFSVDAAKVLGKADIGWGRVVSDAWVTAKARIPAPLLARAEWQMAIMAVEVALMAFLPPVGGVS